jgi:enamine deaminase RidA (YjgF/YER057c/UK114 family)
MEITHLNPESLFANPAFSQGVLVSGEHRTMHVGGQNGTDAAGEIVSGGLGPQTEQALRNVLAVLAAAGTGPEHVVKLTIHLAPGIDPADGFAASAAVWGAHRTAVTVLIVAPARPGALVEVDAIAAVPVVES